MIPCESVVKQDMKLLNALKLRRKSSMWCALEDVKAGNSKAVMSSGNTGVYVASAKLVLGMIPGLQQLALSTVTFINGGSQTLLDVGGTLEKMLKNMYNWPLWVCNGKNYFG